MSAPGFETYLTQASADARYQAVSSIGTDTPSTIDPDDAANAGISTAAARGDHQHAIAAATASGLTNTSSNTEGSSSSFARADHSHAITWNPPACRVYHNTTQSIANGITTQAVLFNSERWDTDNMHSTSVNTERITFNTAGLYVVGFHGALFAASDYQYAECLLSLNASSFIGLGSKTYQSSVFNAPSFSLSTIYKFNVGDWVQIMVGQANTAVAARNLLNGGNYSPEFFATWIGTGN